MPDANRHWTLDPGITFLNHGSFGACPTPVLDAQQELRAKLEREPVLFLGREINERLDEVRAVLAEFVGADPAGLAFVPNATTGVNTVLRSLQFSPGDEILVTDHGYPACNNAADFVAESTGAELVKARVPFPLANVEQIVKAVLDAVTERTRLALVDHVTSPTGLVLPIERIVRELDARGVDSLVDGAHAPGMLPLALDAIGAAYYTGNCHKWMCTPKGAALLWVRADRRDRIRPLVISHGAKAPRAPERSFFHAEADWTGTCDPTAWLSIPAAIEFGRTLLPGGWEAWRAHNRGLALAARSVLCDALGIDRPAPDDVIGALASVPLPDAERDATAAPPFHDGLQTRLFDVHRIEVPIMPWPAPPQRVLRISAQAYNELGEYERLADALRAELDRA